MKYLKAATLHYQDCSMFYTCGLYKMVALKRRDNTDKLYLEIQFLYLMEIVNIYQKKVRYVIYFKPQRNYKKHTQVKWNNYVIRCWKIST